jgi:hypothetical protein
MPIKTLSSSVSDSVTGSNSSVDDENVEPLMNNDIEYMLNLLSDNELEVAARTSYAYVVERQQLDEEEQLRKKERRNAAAEMAQQYLSSKSDKTNALKKMKATLHFQQEMDLDNLRMATTTSTSNSTSNTQAEDSQQSQEYVDDLRKFLSGKKAYVQGYDKDGRSTYLFIPRLVDDHDKALRTKRGHVWSMEKAIACSTCADHTVNVVVDFSGFNILYHSPPFAVGSDLMTTLRNHYVGHVHRIFLINVPTAFYMLWSIFKPFAGTKTRQKIIFVHDDPELLRQFYTDNQATPWMLPNGEKNRELNVEEYLNTPFDQAFDE